MPAEQPPYCAERKIQSETNELSLIMTHLSIHRIKPRHRTKRCRGAQKSLPTHGGSRQKKREVKKYGQSAAATDLFLRKMSMGQNIMRGQNPVELRPSLHHRRVADQRQLSVAAVLPYSANGRSAQQHLFHASARKFLTGCGAVRLCRQQVQRL